MTAIELIEILKMYPEDAKVFFDHDKHDYWRTHIALSADRVQFIPTVYDPVADERYTDIKIGGGDDNAIETVLVIS